MNDQIDKRGGAAEHTNKNMKNVWKAYSIESDLIDIWRKQHIQTSNFTYHCKMRGEYIFSRLDFF